MSKAGDYLFSRDAIWWKIYAEVGDWFYYASEKDKENKKILTSFQT